MHHLVLVHGTFARGAQWTQTGSELHAALTAMASPQSRITVFEWSGRNAFRARADATAELVALLTSLVDADCAPNIHLIAHSHGGNIALQAASAASVRSHVASISCLSTPVLVGREVVALDGHRFTNLRYITAPLLCALPFAFGLSGLSWSGILRLPLIVQILGAVGLAQMAFALLETMFHLSAGAWRHRKAQRHAAMVNLILGQTVAPRIASDKVMFFRHPGDEASALSGVVQILNWVLGNLSERLRRYDQAAAKLGSAAYDVGIPIAIIVVFLVAGLVTTGHGLAGVIVLAAPIVVVVLAAFMPLAVVWTRLLANAMLSLFFGPEMLRAGSHVHVTAEATPTGTWAVTVINVASSQVRHAHVLPRRGLSDVPYPYAHGRTYSDARSIQQLTAWIRRRMDVAAERDC